MLQRIIEMNGGSPTPSVGARLSQVPRMLEYLGILVINYPSENSLEVIKFC